MFRALPDNRVVINNLFSLEKVLQGCLFQAASSSKEGHNEQTLRLWQSAVVAARGSEFWWQR